FSVPEGGVTALLGRNGAGKTTTVRGLLGLAPRTGSVVLAGEQISSLPTHAIVRRGVGYVPEDRDVFAGLTVSENLRLAERWLERAAGPATTRLVEPNLGGVRKVARHVVVIDTGRVGYEGEAAELLGDEPLVRRLLGVA